MKTLYLSDYNSVSLESVLVARNKTIFDGKISLLTKFCDFSCKIVAIASYTCSTMCKFGKLICKAKENSEWQTEIEECCDNSVDSDNTDSVNSDEIQLDIADPNL